MGQEEKTFKINKALLSVSTAVMMLSSAVTVATYASDVNKFTLRADKSSAVPGETINVTLSYEADATGIAGFNE